MKRISPFIPILFVVALLGCTIGCKPDVTDKEIVASGTIEATEVAVASEFGGRVVKLLVSEGESVEAGQIVAELDDRLIQAQISQAKAALAAAQANLAQVKARPTAEQVQIAESALAKAIAAEEGARHTWESAKQILEHPQELLDRIDEARTQVALAEQEVEAAKAAKRRAELERDAYRNPSTEYEIHDRMVRAAAENLEAAKARAAGAKEVLRLLMEMQKNPLALQAQVNAALSQYELAQAEVEVAKAKLQSVAAGSREEELAIAEAQVAQAQAALRALQVRAEKSILRAPLSGRVTEVLVHEGETVAVGGAILTIADLQHLRLVVYVPEDRIGLVQLGDTAQVTVDAFPGEIFTGEVIYISTEAEFTPKNVQTQENRTEMVFAVKISLLNPDGRLKVGMPVDALLLSEASERGK